ncbi:hypothetical protein R1sor_011561 [Riccia sorocarpa]|uniref:Uncharacterized protein n=1 Tax=Riccia sorocarpa TaxID=122646 RepID=A0ABD3I180_9MARC
MGPSSPSSRYRLNTNEMMETRAAQMWTAQHSASYMSCANFAVMGRQPVGELKSPLCRTWERVRRKSLSLTSENKVVSSLIVNAAGGKPSSTLRTCRNCKQQFDPETNHPRACRFHTAHFGGETKRKFESVYTGGTMNTIGGGEIVEYWHCCGNKDRFDPGCEAAPHASYDD